MRIEDCVTENTVITATMDPARTWDRVIVADVVKDRIRNQALLSLTLRPRLPFVGSALHGLITLYGPPGTGKTTLAVGLPYELARYVAGGQVRRIQVNPYGLMSAEHGESQQRVNDLLSDHLPSLASDGKPAVVILDEVESMAVARSEASLATNPADVHRATDAVLTALDTNAREHPHLLWVATSNFTAALDDAFLSRSDASILVPLPDATALRAILADTLNGLTEEYPAIKTLAQSRELHDVAQRAIGLDGRQVRKLVFEALARRLETVLEPDKLTADDLRATISTLRAEQAIAPA